MRLALQKTLAQRALLLLQTLAILSPVVKAFYIPGWSIRSYADKEQIPLLVNKVYSDNTQLQYAYFDLPFVCPPTGQNRHGGLLSGQSLPLNLGEVLRGDRITASDVDLTMGQNTECKYLCTRDMSRKELNRAKQMVREGYVVEWIVDNLPGATSFVTVDKTRKYYAAGFKLGFTDSSSGKPRYFLNNHHTIVIRYRKAAGHAGERGKKIVVGFEVYSKSIGPTNKRLEDGCPADLRTIDQNFELYLAPNRSSTPEDKARYEHSSYHPDPSEDYGAEDDGSRLSIPYSYSVYFQEDNSVEWGHRWDLYFVNQEEGSKIHWLAIINSLIICGLLTGIVLIILAKTIRTDIKSYKDALVEEGKSRTKRRSRRAVGQSGAGSGTGSATPTVGEKVPVSSVGVGVGLGLLDQEADAALSGGDDEALSSGDEALEDVTGWKMLHGDVFRTPVHGSLLAPLVGSGMQLLFMAFSLVFLSAVGILNPSFRGGFVSFAIGLFVFAGVFSGYFSARVYRTFDGQNWRRNTLVTAILFPGLLFSAVFVLNLFVWAQASSTAIPFGTLIGILLLWVGIQVPLVYVGSWYGYVRIGAWEHPTKIHAVPRQIPQQAWYIRDVRTILLAGLIPFAVIFIELLFVFQSVWQDKSGYYYVFGFLSVVSTILIVTIAEVTVVTIYIQLCSENYNWWWQSFLVGGGSSVWVFLYCIWYYFAKLHITGFVSSLLFFSHSFIACCVYALLTGTVGFLSAYAFVRRLYGAIKAD
ncbi:multispanning membrane protein [Grosmannia clavigera kw1407]|uniref:Transmembrane 9 superfamily member n=1 Tax=Grosmannia clavigera (strain kw1407 / UAMH 11150) TaxID=655863 RepID=F0XI44_GROCL|nr:multispanning membrane protein [Grosmannia clavigera kw1407]EFX03222.1 multispanning membrane protein [Grosmannia clavigera kw1407]